ncbi:nucleosome assembly protein 1-like 1 [Parasteatoda tepidariorum]|uniref:nucleosome assembly protein 1-like 1 n=1 Tax=Parasteatoda tepidariorum TaxID=114398 RepID=UPI00077FAB5E|nr:nucleosome assembly protein 1-like 1 [Parasteatoda tepidariorum]
MGDLKDGPDGPKEQNEPEKCEAVKIEADEAGDKDDHQKEIDQELHDLILKHVKMSCALNPNLMSKSARRLVRALKGIQLEHVNKESEFFKELHALEIKYEKIFQPLYDKRAAIITGAYNPTDEECEFQSDSDKELEMSNDLEKVKIEGEDKEKETETEVKGLPEFWLTAFKNAPSIQEMIEEYDEPILKHLIDVKATTFADPMSFTLEFHFEPNEYFTNSVLTKEYGLKCVPDPADVFSFEGPEIVKAKGCTIDWKKGKNVTVKTIKKKQKHKARGAVRTVTKTVQNVSFFNFFSPPAVTENIEEMDEETQNILNNDFEVGNLLKDRVIPHAVLFFTGENMVDDDYDEEEDDEDEDYDEDEDEEDEEDEENDNQCLNRKKSRGQQNSQGQAPVPSECKQQ